MKHPSEWTYGDGAFPEVIASQRVDAGNRPQEPVFSKHPRGVRREYHSMGWFESVYLGNTHTLWVTEDLTRAWVCPFNWREVEEPLAELRRIDSPRQLVEWCMMVMEMVD